MADSPKKFKMSLDHLAVLVHGPELPVDGVTFAHSHTGVVRESSLLVDDENTRGPKDRDPHVLKSKKNITFF
eukprot:2877790-Pyramimonas_sp.AAC.1